jgi:hypothetical protein
MLSNHHFIFCVIFVFWVLSEISFSNLVLLSVPRLMKSNYFLVALLRMSACVSKRCVWDKGVIHWSLL